MPSRIPSSTPEGACSCTTPTFGGGSGCSTCQQGCLGSSRDAFKAFEHPLGRSSAEVRRVCMLPCHVARTEEEYRQTSQEMHRAIKPRKPDPGQRSHFTFVSRNPKKSSLEKIFRFPINSLRTVHQHVST
ncbi:uncharacterized protein LOC142355089 [Convolutriloba macropyga]|uniref:uncharacterized protein LOC142355089 n=1 Tax=Convolutriloba macropyga TaxID=536237 RepID=UPI003F51F496